MQAKATILATGLMLGLGLQSAQADPLSAIDWLDDQPSDPAAFGLVPEAKPLASRDEPPVTRDATRPEITVQPLDDVTEAEASDAVGLLPPHVTGFPATLWQASDTASLADLMRAQNVDGQPAMQSLLFALLLAEAQPPEHSDGAFLLARIDRLIDLGAVAQAAELLALTNPAADADRFARVLDLALLAGSADAACSVLIDAPHLSEDLSPRVYCLAQAGRWGDALTTLETGRALGEISPARYALLLHFLDPEIAEDLPLSPPSLRLTPLEFRLHEALGEPIPSAGLPRAFATADLSGHSGWKAQLEAAERLTRGGALSEVRLFALYGAGRPSASGGVWDRAEAVQRFETALSARDPQAISRSLGRVWPLMVESGLQTAFAKNYASRLKGLPLSGTAASIRLQAALLSPTYETLSRDLTPLGLTQRFAIAVAQGDPASATPPSERARAIRDGFDMAPPQHLQGLLDDARLGEVILRGMSLAYQGHLGDDSALSAALATFRAVGLEDIARRTALQALLLSAQG